MIKNKYLKFSILFISLLSLGTSRTKAQNDIKGTSIGIDIGLNHSYATNYNYQGIAGKPVEIELFTLGLGMVNNFGRWSLKSGLYYIRLTDAALTNYYPLLSPNNIQMRRNQMSRIMLPALLRYNFPFKKIKPFIEIGLCATQNVGSFSSLTIDTLNEMRTGQIFVSSIFPIIGVCGGLGLVYQISDNLNITTDSYFFNNGDPQFNFTGNTFLHFTLGIAYQINERK